MELEPLAAGCRVVKVTPPNRDLHTREYVSLARVSCIDGAHDIIMHQGCQCNEMRAIRNRNIGKVPTPTQGGLHNLRTQAKRICEYLPVVAPWEWGEMPATYSSAKKAKYERAESDILMAGGVSKKDAGVTMFVKGEKINVAAKVDPDPRNIQFRDAKYCVAVARYLKPMEHYLYELHGDGSVLPSTRLIGKGLGMQERASLLEEKLSAFDKPVVLSLDASRFDKHVSYELLEIEHSFYRHMSGNNEELSQLLTWQLINHGISTSGIKYVARGKRMSGDMNTALGNCLLMVLMVSTFMQGQKYDVLDDGDDCLLIVEEAMQQWVEENIREAFLSYGMQLKVESVAQIIEEVDWCQSKPVLTKSGYKFVRNPAKVLSQALTAQKYVAGATDQGSRAKFVNTIGTAELVLNLGVPVLQEFALALMRNAGTNKLIELQDTDPVYYRIRRELHALNMKTLSRREPEDISAETRSSFQRAFGIDVSEQIEIENFLRSWKFELQGDVADVDWFDMKSWTGSPHRPHVYGN